MSFVIPNNIENENALDGPEPASVTMLVLGLIEEKQLTWNLGNYKSYIILVNKNLKEDTIIKKLCIRR